MEPQTRFLSNSFRLYETIYSSLFKITFSVIRNERKEKTDQHYKTIHNKLLYRICSARTEKKLSVQNF